MKLFGGNTKKNIEAILGDFRTKYILPVASLIVIISCFVYTFFTGANDPTPTSPSYGYSDSDNDQNNDMGISDNGILIDDIKNSIREYEIARMNKIKQRLMEMYNAEDKISYSNMSKAFLVNSVANELYQLPIAKSFDNEMDCGVITINNVDLFSVEEKFNYICQKYNLTDFEFKVIISVVYNEAGWTYDDAYRVTNTIYNRTKSKEMIRYVHYLTGLAGDSLYAQVIATAYGEDGTVYKQFSGYLPDIAGYDYDTLLKKDPDMTKLNGIFDFLISENSVHNFRCFKSSSHSYNDYPGATDWIKYTDTGNVYHDSLLEDDLVDGYELVSMEKNKNVLTRKRG